MYLASTTTQSDHEAWYINSGESYHMTPHKEWFYNMEDMMEGISIWGMTQQPG